MQLPSAWRAPRYRRVIALGALLAGLSFYYAFEVSVGRFETLSLRTDYYDLAAEGFRHGHLYLPTQPPTKLLAVANPFDSAHQPLWLWDASLYHGHYYLYWGPVPALLLLAFKVLTGCGKVFDQWLVLVFMLGRLYAGAALIMNVPRSASEQPPFWARWIAIAVFGVAFPTPYFLARPLIYEASVAAGQCFLFLGLWAAERALHGGRLRYLAAASVLWSMAAASRGSLLLAAPLLAAITLAAWTRTWDSSRRPSVNALFALGVPLALSFAAAAAYNYARFDSVNEFGLHHQLTGRPYTGENRYILPNLISYLSAPLEWSCRFPYARLPDTRHLTHLIVWPPDYDDGAYPGGERVAGIALAAPFCGLLALWPARAFVGLVRRVRGSLAHVPRTSTGEAWLVLCSFAASASMLAVVRMYMANTRFLQDGIGGLLMAAILAGFWLLRRTATVRLRGVHKLSQIAYLSLALHSIVTGVCLGFTGVSDNFEHEDPGLYRELSDKLSPRARMLRLPR